MLSTILVFASAAFAQDLNFDQYRKFLMNGSKSSKGFAIQTTCTNSAGQTFKIGEKNYDLCLTEISSQSKHKSTTQNSTTTIHIGN
ncbi:MAG: hypothetical protein IPM97_12195 [Bdellovibrionaceae bacterium]|nr:hypothetical protein [Pseudobdellovibrionaceae bacterium]